MPAAAVAAADADAVVEEANAAKAPNRQRIDCDDHGADRAARRLPSWRELLLLTRRDVVAIAPCNRERATVAWNLRAKALESIVRRTAKRCNAIDLQSRSSVRRPPSASRDF